MLQNGMLSGGGTSIRSGQLDVSNNPKRPPYAVISYFEHFSKMNLFKRDIMQ